MPVLSAVPKRKKGSKKVDDIPAMILEDGCVFNLQALMAGLGLTEESTKKWCSRNRITSVSQGRTWLFTGEMFRRDLAANHARQK
jgi:hypothetical protein